VKKNPLNVPSKEFKELDEHMRRYDTCRVIESHLRQISFRFAGLVFGWHDDPDNIKRIQSALSSIEGDIRVLLYDIKGLLEEPDIETSPPAEGTSDVN